MAECGGGMRHTHPSPPLTRPRHDTLPASPRRLALPTHSPSPHTLSLTHSLLTLPLPTLIFLTSPLSDLFSLTPHPPPAIILSHAEYITFFQIGRTDTKTNISTKTHALPLPCIYRRKYFGSTRGSCWKGTLAPMIIVLPHCT